MRSVFAIFTLFFFFAFGLFFSKYSKNYPQHFPVVYQQTSHQSSSGRDPAAIKRTYDFSDLEGIALDHASKQRIISGSRIIKDQGEIGFELGHFVVKSDDGSKAFACQKFTNVVLQFQGEGSAVGGETPSMELEGACVISSDINLIAPLWIPVARILGEPVADGEFDFREKSPVKIRFTNVIDQWPTKWKLRTVRLTDKKNVQKDVVIDEKELREMSPRPVIIQF